MPILVVAVVLAAVAWLYLLVARGGFWRTDCRLPRVAVAPSPPWPSVAAVIPARDEAAMLPVTLPALLSQAYPGEFSVILVDDDSTDGTASMAAGVAADLGQQAGPVVPLSVITGTPAPAGWAGKVWAMAQGARAAGERDYLLFTDADIAFQPGALTALVTAAVGDRRALVSQMALLRAESGWERWIVPAFVYFFAQLYPFRLAGRERSRTAAAAGGCLLVHRETLAAAGGLAGIAAARIDDVALARLLKRGPARARCWLGFTTAVRSLRPYPGLAVLWDMVARSAYTQLRYSPALLAGTLAGLLWLYLLPPLAGLGGLVALMAGGSRATGWAAAAGLAGWAVMAATYLPVLRLYRLSWLRAPALPLIALLYAGMTADSARRHHAGRGGEWKGRTIAAGRTPVSPVAPVSPAARPAATTPADPPAAG
jgi:hopene-associated glycosyltransferase HpnB